MTIVEMRDNLRSMMSPVDIVRDIVMADGDMIVELQKDQFMYGKDATDENIKPQYKGYSGENTHYAAMKQAMNDRPDFGTPDLRLTGDFYNGFYFDTGTLQVASSDAKTPSLIEKYGKHIFGLSEATAQRYRRIFNPKFWGVFRAQLARKN